MNSITSRCPECQFLLQVPDRSWLGRPARCPKCQSRFVLEASETIDASPSQVPTQAFAASPGDTTDPDPASPAQKGTPTRSAQPSWIRVIDNRYELIERLGGGGFGVVWKARDLRLDRVVALKLPRQELFDAGSAKQVQREAQAAARLRHPNIVSVYEVKNDGELIYIVSEYIEGITLTEWMEGQAVSSRQAAEIALKLAETIEHAHEAGIVHRDLKPGNVLVDSGGELHITDFGLAKRDDLETSLSEEGRAMGTPAYMSPEQARGESRQADRRTDIYSLGVMIFELLTGDRPFRGNKWGALQYQILTQEPPKPRTLNPDVAPDLDTICLKCLEKDPSKRYQTAAALAAELRRFLNGEPILARPIGRVARFWRACKRQPVIASLTGLLALALLVGSLITTHFGVEANLRAEEALAAKNDAIAERDKAQKNEARAVTAENQLRSETDRVRLQQARQNVAEGWRQLELAYENKAASAWPEHLLWFARALTLSPDGSQEQQINRMRLASALSQNPLEDFWWNVRFATFSPDGQRIATTSDDGEVAVYETGTHKKLASFRAANLPMVHAAFNSDGSKIAAVGHHKKATVWDVETRKRLYETSELTAPPVEVAFHPLGDMIFVKCHPSRLERFDLPERQAKTEWAAIDDPFKVLALSPDTKRVLAKRDEKTAVIIDSLSGTQIGQPMQHSAAIRGGTFSSNGQLVATFTEMAERERVVQKTRPRFQGKSQQNQKNFAPAQPSAKKSNQDNQPLEEEVETYEEVYQASDVRVWSAETGDARTDSLACGFRIHAVTFDPENRFLAAGGTPVEDGLPLPDTPTQAPDANPTEPNEPSPTPRNFTLRAGKPVPTPSFQSSGPPRGRVALWSLSEHAPRPQFVEANQEVQGLTFSSDGLSLLTLGGGEGPVSEVQSWAVHKQGFSKESEEFLWPIEFFPKHIVASQGRVLVSGTGFEGSGARLWNLNRSVVQGILEESANSYVAEFSEDGETIRGSGASFGQPQILAWDARTLKIVDKQPVENLQQIQRTKYETVFEERAKEYTVFLDIAPKTLTRTYTVAKQVALPKAYTVIPAFSAQLDAWLREKNPVIDSDKLQLAGSGMKRILGASPDQKQLILQENSGFGTRSSNFSPWPTIRLVDAQTGELLSRTMTVEGEIALARMAPDQRLLVVVAGPPAPVVEPAPLPPAAEVLDGPTEPVSFLQPNAEDFTTSVMLWDLDTARLVMPTLHFPERPGSLIQFDQKGQRFLIQFESGLYLFDLLPDWLVSDEELVLLAKWASFHEFDVTGTAGDIDRQAVSTAWQDLVR